MSRTPGLWAACLLLATSLGGCAAFRAHVSGQADEEAYGIIRAKQIEALAGYLETGDAEAACRQAHTIKGASANVGGEALRETAYGLEQAGKAGDLDFIKAGIPELEAQFERLREAMSATV